MITIKILGSGCANCRKVGASVEATAVANTPPSSAAVMKSPAAPNLRAPAA